MKVAVFLRGHKRVWEYTKQNIIEFCNSLSDHVDYYVAVWDNKKYEVGSMRYDFPSSQLKAFVIAPDIDVNGGAFLGPPHLSSILSSYRLDEELNAKCNYDFILDTRFDVQFKKLSDITIPKNMSIGSTIIDQRHGIYRGMEDHCFVADRITHTIWNHRFYQCRNQTIDTPNSHAWLMEYAKSYGITPFKIPWFKAYITRPNAVNVDIDTLHAEYYDIDGPWHAMTKEEKIKIINDLGCDPDEYVNQLL